MAQPFWLRLLCGILKCCFTVSAADYVALVTSSCASQLVSPGGPCHFTALTLGLLKKRLAVDTPALDISLGLPKGEGQHILALFLSPQIKLNTFPSSFSSKGLRQARSGVGKGDRPFCLGGAWEQLPPSPQASPCESVAAYGVGSLHWEGRALSWGNEHQYQTEQRHSRAAR